MIERDLETFEHVRAALGLGEIELGAAAHHDLAVQHVLIEQRAQRQHLRPVVDQPEHDRAEGALQRRVHEQLVQHHLGIRVLLELDHDAHAIAIGLVAQIADAGELGVANHVGDALEQHRLVDLERNLRGDQAEAAGAAFLDLHLRPHADQPAAGQVAVANALRAVNDAAGREVRPGDDLQQLLGRGLGPIDHLDDRFADLGEVVRRHFGGHADRDAGATVDQQIRQHAREHGRLLARFVVVGAEIDGVLLEVGQHFDRERRQPGLGVSHGCRRVAVDRAEVALPVDQRIAHHPALRQAHQRGIHHLFAVRVIVARGVAGDLRALAVRPPGREVQIVHRDQDAAL